MADKPGCHETAVRITRDRYLRLVNKAELPDRVYASHHVPPWTIAGVVVDGSLIGVPHVVTAPVVGLEDDISSCRHQLGQIFELCCRSRPGTPMNVHYERIFLVFAEIGWIDEETVLAEAVWPLALERFHLAKLQRGDLLVVIRQPLRSVRGRWHEIKLGRVPRRAAGECDLIFWPDGYVDPKVPSGIYIAQGQLASLTFERLQPQGNLSTFVPADQQRLAVWDPDGALHITVELAREVAVVAARNGNDKDFVDVVEIAIARVAVGQLRAIGREQAGAFELLVVGELADLACFDVQNLQSGRVMVAGMMVLLSSEGQQLAVRRPRNGRDPKIRRTTGKAPWTRGQSFRVLTPCAHKPNM